MVKKLLWFLCFFGAFSWCANADSKEKQTAYDFTFKKLVGGQPLSLRDFRGNVILIVNTASKCGFTKQYEGLEKLYQRFKDQGLVIIGVPSNDFGKQEPASNKDIANFCRINFGVSFPMAAKESVSGKSAHPFYLWAHRVLGFGTAPKWNFHKYLIDREGHLVDYFHSTTAPDAPRLVHSVETLLQKRK